MNPILQAAIGSILRWALALGAGWLVNRGIWTEGEATTYVAAAALALLSIVWSVWAKYRARIKFLTALESPPGTSEMRIDANIKAGLGAPIALLLAVSLALAGGGAGCALKDARHQAVVGSTVLFQALAAVDDTELALSQSGAPSVSFHAASAEDRIAREKSRRCSPSELTAVLRSQPANWPRCWTSGAWTVG